MERNIQLHGIGGGDRLEDDDEQEDEEEEMEDALKMMLEA